jgi:hypothetical protein
MAPEDFRTNRQRFIAEFHPEANRTVDYIAREANRSPQLRTIVVWDKIERVGVDPDRDDPVKTQLGTTWRRINEQTFAAFDHWTWQKLYQVRRREYVRVG